MQIQTSCLHPHVVLFLLSNVMVCSCIVCTVSVSSTRPEATDPPPSGQVSTPPTSQLVTKLFPKLEPVKPKPTAQQQVRVNCYILCEYLVMKISIFHENIRKIILSTVEPLL